VNEDALAFLTLVFAIGAIGTWLVAWALRRTSDLAGHAPNARERAQVAVRDAIVATVLSGLGIVRLQAGPVPSPWTSVLLLVAIALVVFYPIRWAWLLWRGRLY
jgi:hypothetical protein